MLCIKSVYPRTFAIIIYIYIQAMKNAVKYLREQGGDDKLKQTPIARVMEGKEPKEFWDAFNGKPVTGRGAGAKRWKK